MHRFITILSLVFCFSLHSELNAQVDTINVTIKGLLFYDSNHPANPSNSIFCNQLSLAAVHGAMAGKTGFVVGQRANTLVHLPIPFVTAKRKMIDVEGDLWLNVLEFTGQPISMKN